MNIYSGPAESLVAESPNNMYDKLQCKYDDAYATGGVCFTAYTLTHWHHYGYTRVSPLVEDADDVVVAGSTKAGHEVEADR